MTTTDSNRILALLSIVVLSPLALLIFGLNSTPGPTEIIHLPTTVAEVAFISALVLKTGIHKIVDCLTGVQRIVILLLALYVTFVSFSSDLLSSRILGPSWIIHIVFFVAVLSFFKDARENQADQVWTILGLTALFHVCAFMTAWIVWPEEIRQGWLPVFDNIRHLGYLLAPAATVMAVRFLTRLEKPGLPIVCFAAAIFYIFYTGSRGAAIALLAALVVTALYLARHDIRVYIHRALILTGVMALLILAAELLPSLPWPPVFGRGVNAFAQSGAELLNGRSQIWISSLSAIKQNWVWGYGPAIMSQIPEYHGPQNRHPHNLVLQILLHWGILGTLILIATCSTFASSVWFALIKKPRTTYLTFAALLTISIHALVDGGLFYPFSTVIAIIAFANLCAIGARYQSQGMSNSASNDEEVWVKSRN